MHNNEIVPSKMTTRGFLYIRVNFFGNKERMWEKKKILSSHVLSFDLF